MTTLRIEKIVYGGDGLARLPAAAHGAAEAPDGRRLAVFVPFTLPGEAVEAELEPAARGRTPARLLRVIEPSPGRVAPGCEYFSRCGGCQLQHAAPQLQLDLKRAMLLETLQRTGGVAFGGKVVLHPSPPWGYRNRIRLQAIPGAVPPLGYHQRESRRLLPIAHCPIASPAINRALQQLYPAALAPGAREFEIVADNRDAEVRIRPVGLASGAPLRYTVGDCQYRVSPDSFFQVNRFLTPELVAHVVPSGEAVAGFAGQTAVDLFSGVGLFTLPLAAGFARVHAVENHPSAVADLRANVAAAPGAQPRIRVHPLAALEYFRSRAPEPIDLLVADPPRAGLGPALVAALLADPPRRIHLVACDPATLGRDLRPLLQAGYQLDALHLFDLFPQTSHLETVAFLARR